MALPPDQCILRKYFDASPEGMVILEPVRDASGGVVDFRFVHANAAVERRMGLSRAELLARNYLSVFSGAMSNGLFEILRRTAETGAGYRGEFEYDADGLSAWFHLEVFGDDGRVMVTSFDITERVRAQRERQATASKLQLFVENAPAAVAMLDREMRYVLVSERWIRDYGLEGRPIIGRSHYEVFPTIPPRWKELHRRCLNGERIFCEEDSFLDESGMPQWLRWELVPWRGEDGSVAGLVMFTESINEQKQAELERVRHQWILEERNQELTAARQEAEAASRAKSAFLANMSHEIRTPMNAILGYSGILAQRDITEDQRHDAIETITRNGEHLLALVNDVLDLSKIEAGQVRLESKAVDVARVCRDVESTLRVRAESSHIGLVVEIDELLPSFVKTDPLRLRQILMNLASNAIKFTSVGGKVVLRASSGVGLERATDGSAVLRFDVIDNGIGISEAEARVLFQPFMQADASTTRRFGGTGLGLALSRELARTLGGDLWLLESAPNEGSHFRLQFPLVPAHAAETSSPEETLDASEESLCFTGTPRVLLVEDGIDNQRLFQFHLRSAGAAVTVVDNGQEALDLYDHAHKDPAQRFPFDLVLMDMQMPVLDGYRATESLRMLGVGAPILALTAHALAEDRDRCMESGCSDFLTKPISKNRLLRVCDRWLREAQRQAA